MYLNVCYMFCVVKYKIFVNMFNINNINLLICVHGGVLNLFKIH